MALLDIDPISKIALSVYQRKGAYALLLGSGLSSAAGIPTGGEISKNLLRLLAAAKDVCPLPANPESWFKRETGNESDYSVTLETAANSPIDRHAILNSYIEPSRRELDERLKQPTKAHMAIANLVRDGFVRIIITTNFDRLMENALTAVGVEPTIVASEDDLENALPPTYCDCYLFKLHGDYRDSRIRNTGLELSSYPQSYKKRLSRIFDEHGLIICGWSGATDKALRLALRSTPSKPTYWVTRSKLTGLASQLANKINAERVEILDADNFFEKLQSKVDFLEQSQSDRKSLNLERLVRSTKSYVAKPECYIQLNDLFMNHVRRLCKDLDSTPPPGNRELSGQKVADECRRHEELTRPLVCMAGVLGEWGKADSLNLMLKVLEGLLCLKDERLGGDDFWQDLRIYPAVMVFVAYGMGLTQAARWPVLFEVFSRQLHIRSGESKKVVHTLFYPLWSNLTQGSWELLFERALGRESNPYLLHLKEVMKAWYKDFMGMDDQFWLIFYRFVSLGALDVFANDISISGLIPALFPQRAAILSRLVQEFSDETFNKELLEAGFAGGNKKTLSAFVEKLKESP